MPFCANCGTNMTGTFCPNCGTPAGAPPAATPNPPSGFAPPPPTPQDAPSGAQSAGLSENAACTLCYIVGFVTGIVFLVMAPYNANPRVKFHAWQSIFFNIAWIAFWMAINVLTSMAHIFALVLLPIYALISFAGFLFWLFLMWKAYSGENFEIPVVGPLARQQAAK
ncbi:MAG TPA: hypothetical protein VGK29_07475 [Paludibaculum sp.]|jgi:uncharacterized membrane protein